ncbi:hypothetical protein [Chamaesiphon sp.]|uniref:hypothetical protein n=1 Tax=Chamaesiphon sp. TaxID=2814140 RepID=UPI00359461EB
MILNRLIDRAGDSNPQIFRELKERLTLRNIGIAIATAVLLQGLVLLYFNGQIPIPVYDEPSSPGASIQKLRETHNTYCMFPRLSGDRYDDLCKLADPGNFVINWQKWWSHVFAAISWILPLGLILGSVYLLVADLVQEEKRGTLNFIRLSPQSARQIFIGKIFGVPIMVYLAAALMVPLHVGVGLTAGGNLPLIASWYAAIGALWFLLSSAAVLYVLLGGIQAILTVIVVGYPICLPLAAINVFTLATIDREKWLNASDPDFSWFGLPIASNAIGFNAFSIGCCLVISYWVWQALERRYLNPTATTIGKSQSYLMNLCLQVGIAGFAIPLALRSNYYKEGGVVGLAVMDALVLALLIPMLLPTKQALQDWSRHRRERVTHQQRFWKRELYQDLIHNDKSPALLAIAINIGMAMVLWLPLAAISCPSDRYGIRFLASVCLAASLMLIYAAIAHLGLFLNVRKRNVWILAIVAGVITLPLVGAFILSPHQSPTGLAAIMLLFSPFAALGMMQLSGGTILATFAAQLVVFAALTRQLQRKIQIAGQSSTTKLLTQT